MDASFVFGVGVVFAGITGVASHVALYRKGEWHLRGVQIIRNFSTAFVFLSILFKLVTFQSWYDAVGSVNYILAVHAASIFASMTVYRIVFHPLGAFPGPSNARVSKFWHVWQCRTSKNYLVLDELRQKYGNFVRTGPNELTVFDPSIMAAAASNRVQPFGKSDWYDFLHPFQGLNALRDPKEHDMRRRIWDQGFTTKALEDYQQRAHKYGYQLEQQLRSRVGQPMDMRNWFYFLTFDIMGDLTFGTSFDMIKNATWHSGPMVIRKGLRLLSWATPVPWLGHIAFQIPFIPVVKDWYKMLDYCRQKMDERLQVKSDVRDITAALIDGSIREHGSIDPDIDYIYGDAVALIIAGSDTVAATLVHLFYRLCRHPHVAATLTKEIRSLDNIEDQKTLKDLPYLNACINETLRLHPAVPTGGLRQVPEGGITVAGHFIPGGTTLCIPQYSLQRSCSSFSHADQFIPERWLDRGDLVQNKAAFAPFAVGRYNCVGKQLGLMELRFTTALLLSKYDFKAAYPQELDKVESDLRDTFTALPGSLELIFTPVEKQA